MTHVIKPAAVLFIIAVVTTALLSLTHMFTLEPIAAQAERTRQRVMREVLAQADDYKEIEAEASGSIVRVFEGTKAGEMVGYVVMLSPEGYSGTIDMMVGISSADETISGMRVMKHSETPGLGALAVRKDFYQRYDGKPLIPLHVIRGGVGGGIDGIDAITSATITTRAITDAVNEAIEWYNGGGGK